MKKSRLAALLAAGTLLLGGCGLLPEPSSLIQAPSTVSAEAGSQENLAALARSHVPRGTVLSVPSAPIGEDSVLPADFDADGKDEVVVLYHARDSHNQVGAFVLQQEGQDWKKAFTVKGSGYEISWASTNDITGDGVPELLLGWKVGNLAGNVLEIYQNQNGKFQQLKKLNFHQLELIDFEGDLQSRLAVWKKDVVDAFEVDLLKWEKNGFILDKHRYPAYFPRVVQYYERRTEAVPDAAYYWYYLADAHLKAKHPELAYRSIQRGMQQKIVIPSYEAFTELQESILAQLEGHSSDFLYEVRSAGFTMSVPKEMVPDLMIKEENGPEASYRVTVSRSHYRSLFTVSVFSKDMYVEREEDSLEKIAETDELLFFVEKEGAEVSRISNEEAALRDKLVSSIRPGLVYPSYRSLEEDSITKLVKQATNQYWYVASGGKMPGGELEMFTYDDLDYRHMGTDLDSIHKLTAYLSESFTSDSIQSFVKRMKFIEHEGRLAQPNADGGSLANFEKAEVVQVSGNSEVKKVDIKVPLGSSLSYELVPIEIQKTEAGWRISSEPGTF
ncbi:hypothetical protein WQ57_23500 [Mesobacillus campisalis]|uniref:Lipoprotein n=1 Tax=Mesobacillus campisalis TaxID=1408103 RepID=A0A0M2SL36_9BACI|nr:DL-endopeptidase inhibitor IseA family protein [Mesobacillus campisalis]KKK33587.1 hypothetical protein WQ57_23500 [Mesobacillus campisalis]